MEKSNYGKLFLMLAVSFIIMYSVMFFNVDKVENIHININRFYMAVLMTAPMGILMLVMMSSMFKNKKMNGIILTACIIAIGTSFIMLRNQSLVGDVQFMKSMIPHHSSAVLVSENADIKDPEVQKLARQIID